MTDKKKKNLGGRPMKFKTPEEMQKRIDEYFDWAAKNNKPLTVERFAVFLGVDRVTIHNYSHRDKFFNTIKRARNIIVADKVERLIKDHGSKVGIIFDLKNNEGWKDKQELEHTGELKGGTRIVIVRPGDKRENEPTKDRSEALSG